MLVINNIHGMFRSDGAGCLYCVLILPTLSSAGANQYLTNIALVSAVAD